jgi:hypothetical protein
VALPAHQLVAGALRPQAELIGGGAERVGWCEHDTRLADLL